MRLESWSPLPNHAGATYGELIDAICDEARARSTAGYIIGGALVIKLESPSGRLAIGIQVHTVRSEETFVLPLADDGVSLEAAQPLGAIIQDGLCAFRKNPTNAS